MTTGAENPSGTASLEGSSYEVIRRRLVEQANALGAKAEAVNAKRKTLFGGRELALIETSRIRTENNCIPRDVLSVSGLLVFGFQVFLGLKSETTVKDVFSVYQFGDASGKAAGELSPLGFEGKAAFLSDP